MSEGAVLTVVAFGPLSEVVPAGFELRVPTGASPATVKRALETEIPELAGAVYRLALDARFLDDGRTIGEGGELSLLPPFAGG